MTFEEICKLDPMILSLYQEAGAFRVLSDTSVPMRTFSAERAAQLQPDPNFCRTQLWRAKPKARGEVGLLFLLKQRVGWSANGPSAVPELATEEAYTICYRKIVDAMPACQHAPGKEWTAEGPEYLDGVMHGQENMCIYDYPIPAATPTSLSRQLPKPGFFSTAALLAHAARMAPEPEPVFHTGEDWREWEAKLEPADEPFFLVKSKAEAEQLAINLEIVTRWQKHEISTWYGRNAIMIADDDSCKIIIKSKLKKENIIGGLGWKPVVLTFSNPKLSAKLTEIGLAVTETDGIPESLESFRNTVVVTAPNSNLKLPDMPEAALDGWLGKVCRERMADFPLAFAWPALLVVAGALVDESPIRTNLYVGLIGEVGSGKTSAIRKAIWLLGMAAPVLVEEKIGSGEGLAMRIGDVGNSARLWFPDELGHTMAKAQIQNATFPETLTTAWSTNQNNATIARQKLIAFSCRLSIAGGLVTDRFGDAFGSAATGGLWDRFIFGECPTGFAYSWRPDKGEPVRAAASPADEETNRHGLMDESTVAKLESVDDDVYAERDRWIREEGINRRVAENSLRVAAICAAFDGRGTLRAADLGPTLEFARYQEKMRGLHKPNPGKNESGIIFHRITEYLERHSADEQWNERSRVLQNTNVYDFGPGLVDRVLDSMESGGQIEQKKQGRKRMLRKRI